MKTLTPNGTCKPHDCQSQRSLQGDEPANA